MGIATLSALAGLFVAAFGAATILPFQSEVVFGAMVAAETAPIWLLVAVASVGNTLGSVVNYWLGLFVEHFKHRRWFPASERQLARAQAWYLKYGVWTLLLSWAPFADPLTVVAGIFRTPFWLFLALVTLAKSARYVIVAWLLA
jgi:membrane protein YqaA with SNARE-associated domain